MKSYIYSIFAVMIVICFGCQIRANSLETNVIKRGEAIVNLIVESESSLSADSLRCEILWTTLLDVTNDGAFRSLNPVTFKDGSARVPMETLYRDGIAMEIKDLHNNYLGSFALGLHQNKPLNITLHFDKENHIIDVDHSGGTGNVVCDGQYGRIRMNFGSTTVTDKEDWENPQRFLAWQLESMLPENIREAFRDVDISETEKKWMTSNLTLVYCATSIITYEKRAKSWGVDFVGVDTTYIRQPPIEFFDFMNKLDYSSVMLNDFTNSLRQVCNNILTELPIGITPIGETSIEVWQSDIKTRLKGVIDNPTQLLLDLLTATSYFNQIQYDNIPLSPKQLSNVYNFYSGSDLGSIIISRNENPFPNIITRIEWID